MSHTCPLCEASDATLYDRDALRTFWQCQRCFLVFVPGVYFLSAAEEKAHYDLHENDPGDVRYRQFLSRIADPVKQRVPPGSSGLDFGSGPGPTLSVMLNEMGLKTVNYDPIYCKNEAVWEKTYDFITASEVAEHLHRPRFEINRLWFALRPGGILAIMTKRVRGQQMFKAWHYKRDPTHVIFFHEKTFRWLSRHLDCQLHIAGDDVVLLRK